ncbi:hypothetical protein ACFOUW_18690 [Tenggerimyces flavus]|uniref:Uncharacterized protein n=2 Tax=Tenggerimyces flavus TaxID=1708749 RepID=A0ABV7YC20_9ACTN
MIVAWHPFDPPRSETALAAALPLDGVDAWRFYVGLPLSGKRLPNGGLDGLMELILDDAVLRVHGPVSTQAVAEFGPALATVRSEYGIEAGPLGLLGGSLGGGSPRWTGPQTADAAAVERLATEWFARHLDS